MKSKALEFGVWILAVYAIGLLMHQAATIFIWVVCSVLLFALLDPTAEKLKSLGNSTLLSSLALVLGATAATVFLIFLLGRFSADMVVELQGSRAIFLKYYQQLDQGWSSFSESLTHAFKVAAPPGAVGVPTTKVELVQNSPIGGELRDTLMHGLGSAVTIFTFAILVPILTFFLLAERDSLRKVSARVFDNPATGSEIWHKIVVSTRAFFLGNLVLGLVTYPIFAILFLCFSVPSAFTLAGLASFFNLIPFLGAVLAGFLPALTVLGEGDRVAAAIAVYGVCVLIHFAVANFVTPKILGSKVDINATVSTIALVAWGELWGGPGLILAIPITAAIKIIFAHSGVPRLEWFAAMMSDDVDTALKPRVRKAGLVK
ncbi:MAG: AI-2E family transporter [Proteobacteria bacterium]|nr:MAG: AI-2E family transporter [Pseudomonadota bacterium]